MWNLYCNFNFQTELFYHAAHGAFLEGKPWLVKNAAACIFSGLGGMKLGLKQLQRLPLCFQVQVKELALVFQGFQKPGTQRPEVYLSLCEPTFSPGLFHMTKSSHLLVMNMGIFHQKCNGNFQSPQHTLDFLQLAANSGREK